MLEFDNSRDALFNPGAGKVYFDGLQLIRFEPQRTDYRPHNAWWLAELSRLIYRRSSVEGSTVLPDRRTLLDNAGLKETHFFTKDGTQAAVVTAPSFTVLVFRGTEEVSDWIANIDVLKPKHVHEGFNRQLDGVWDKVTAALKTLPGPLFLTGHSLGAALAILAGARLGGDGVKRTVYAYGAPRVGDATFVKSYPANVTVHRIVNDNDAVTVLPPAFLGYEHVGTARCITEDGRLVVGQPSQGLQLAKKVLKIVQALREKKELPLPDCLTDHAPVNYVAWMQRLSTNP